MKWPPLDPGVLVRTTQPNLTMKKEWTAEGWASKRWGVRGVIAAHHDSHGLCYDVLHEDGSQGCYDPSEFEVILIHLRKNPDDASMKPVECGEVGVASITEAWGFYGPGGEGHKDVCTACIDARRDRRGAR